MLTVKRNFPLPRIQTGALTGNGKTGEMIWGSGNVLNVTLGCADLWDHRGGMEWTDKQNYKDIRCALEKRDITTIRKLFAPREDGAVHRPSLVPVGRLVITLPDGAELLRYEQTLQQGRTRIYYTLNAREKYLDFYADMTMQDAVACSGLENCVLQLKSSWKLFRGVDYRATLLSEHNSLEERGFAPVQEYQFEQSGFFIQPMPVDPAFAMLYRREGDCAVVSFYRGLTTEEDVKSQKTHSFEEIRNNAELWWAEYWKEIPVITHDDPAMEELYWHGLYKYGIMTNPAGITPGLQGPWIEDDRLPPWQGDYHFNINVQLCNLPGLRSGKFAHLRKLFDMVFSWRDKLRNNARCFTGIDDGYMLPHAVDDHALCMGKFWPGTIDHGCSAWIAMMMFDYCDYSGDIEYLRNDVYDFMKGVMKVFECMLEFREDGSLCLPVSISPEYRGSDIDAWGSNSSFQLAALHRLAENLIKASVILEEKADPFWHIVREKLPEASVLDGEIGLWDGLLLEESHRHHSHLGGLCPFDIIDPEAPRWKKIIDKTLEHWVNLGMGGWTGWCMPWASQIFTRLGNGDMANLILNIWKTNFTNEGGGSLHDGWFKGFSIWADIRGEVMQMDGGMGAVTAIQEQFLHTQNGILRAFYGTPSHGRHLTFDHMFASGGFRVSGKKVFGEKPSLKITATRDQTLKIQMPGTALFEKEMKKGETICLIREKDVLIPANLMIKGNIGDGVLKK